MPEQSNTVTSVQCVCGSVTLEAIGPPITSVICYCDDCQESARQIEALPNAVPVNDADGGTAYVLFRKDRVKPVGGEERLCRHKLKEAVATSRAVASCCNSALFIDVEKGHWLSIYRARLHGDLSPVEMRIQTKFKPDLPEMRDGIPGYKAIPFRFIVKLLKARVAMLFQP